MKLYTLQFVFVCLGYFCTAGAMEEGMGIFQAVGDGDTKQVKLLLIANFELANAQGFLQWTPLHTASSRGHTDTAKLLLDHKANVNAKGCDKWTPLHYASYWDRTETAALLLSYGAIPYSPINLFENFSSFSKLYAQGHQAFINKVKKERDEVFWILRSIKCKEGGARRMLPAELCDKIVVLAFGESGAIKEWQQFKKVHPDVAALADAQEEEPS